MEKLSKHLADVLFVNNFLIEMFDFTENSAKIPFVLQNINSKMFSLFWIHYLLFAFSLMLTLFH